MKNNALQATGAKMACAPCWRASPSGICVVHSHRGTTPRHRICVACLDAVAAIPIAWCLPNGPTLALLWCPPSSTKRSEHIQTGRPSFAFASRTRFSGALFRFKAKISQQTFQSLEAAAKLLSNCYTDRLTRHATLSGHTAATHERPHRCSKKTKAVKPLAPTTNKVPTAFLLLPDPKAPAAQISSYQLINCHPWWKN